MTVETVYLPLSNQTGYLWLSLSSFSLSQERLSFHRTQLRQRLGLVAQGKVFSTGMEQLFDDSDLLPGAASVGRTESAKKNVRIYWLYYSRCVNSVKKC